LCRGRGSGLRRQKEKPVTKRELVIDVAERLGYTQNEVSNVVQATLDAIIDSLAEGERLEIRNFGVFEIKKRDARMGRNPRTGQEVPISEKRVATFKPGKALKELVAGGEAPGPMESDETTLHVPKEEPPTPPRF
jgi:nucleoid DNA-binding protein